MKTNDLPDTGNNMIGSDSLIGFLTRQDTALVEDQRKNWVQLARQIGRERSRIAPGASNEVS